MDTSELLEKIADGLDALKTLTDELKRQNSNTFNLGFCESPRFRFVYCNRQEDCNWYFMEGDKRIPISHSALMGVVQTLDFKRKEVKVGSALKESWKLRLYIHADHLYCLESGFDTVFSKCLLSTIAHLTPEQLSHPLTLEPQASMDVNQVLFCRIYAHTGEQIYAPWSDTVDWVSVTQKAIVNLKGANPRQHDPELPPWDSIAV